VTRNLMKIKGVILSIRARFLECMGEYVEKPISQRLATREMRRLGHTDALLKDLDGESEIYTWAVIGGNGVPTHVIKTSPPFGIRSQCRTRKLTPLFDHITPRERVSLIVERARSLYCAGHGSKPTSEPKDRYGVIEWATGTLLKDMPASRDSIQSVVSTILELDLLGFHHGDLHAGNVVISDEDRILLIDSDNQFTRNTTSRTALAVDLAVLSGSLLILHGTGRCIEEKYTVLNIISETVGDQLMAEISRIAFDHRTANRWLRAVAQELRGSTGSF